MAHPLLMVCYEPVSTAVEGTKSTMWLLSRNKQRGFAALTYVLVAVFLIAAIGGMMASSRWGSNNADKQWSMAMDMVAQANLIRNRLNDCAMLANQSGYIGSQTLYVNNGSSGHHPYYPAQPSDTGHTGFSWLIDAKCPNPSNNTTPIIGGEDGVFLPPTPSGFYQWVYRNNTSTTTVHIELIALDATRGAYWTTALQIARDKLGADVAAIVSSPANPTLRVYISK